MHNKTISLPLGKSRYHIKPDMKLIFEIEDEICGLPELHRRFTQNSWKVTELVILTQILLQAAGETPDLNFLYTRMQEEGLPIFHATAVKFLNAVLTGSLK